MPNISTGRGAVIITGASSGIGAATARLVAASGYAVCVNYRSNEDAANEVVSSIVDDGGRAAAIFADVTDPENVSRLCASAQDQLGELKGLVNNAAIERENHPIEHTPLEE